MRHSVNIFFGKRTDNCLLALHKYMLRSGEGDIDMFFRSYLYVVEGKEIRLERVIQNENGDFVLTTEKRIATTAIDAEIPTFIQDTHRQMITIHNRGDFANLHICLYFPLLEDVSHITSFVSAIENGGFNYVDIDAVCLAGDLCNAISSEYATDKSLLKLQKQTGDGLKQLVDFKKNQPKFQHLLAIQDYQNGGAALSLELASLTRILGEFSLMIIEDYTSVFGNLRSESEFQTIGLSMLQLDKFYFLEYLMRKTLKRIAEREQISIDKVDINKASKQADELLHPWLSLLSDLYRNEIRSSLDRKQSETEVVAQIDALLNERFEKMRSDLESYLTDDKLSLPDKKAVLSAILGQDDILFINDLYDEELLNFHDLEKEAIEHFTSTNNYILRHQDYVQNAVLSDDEEEARYPIEEMRKNRITLRRTIGYLRELEAEQKRLEQQMNLQEHANDCFIGEGVFTIGEHKYKLLPHVDDIPLTENYTPHATQLPSVDLTGLMPRVKDQGQQGACLAFSLTSIFEQMYKKMTQQEIDLSEQFLYYIAREKAGEIEDDKGSCLHYAVEALAEKGICVENKWAYNTPDTAFNIKPSEEAFQDAQDRKLAEAKNVPLEVDAIRSALADGYPVVISAKLYDSFGEARATGYVPLPSDEEIKSSDPDVNRNHAMVIVGFNDEIHAFKVRNSWGENFGLGGYIFMPYTYITNTELTSYAAILTEIRLAKTITEKYVVQQSGKEQNNIPRLEFDRSDTRTQYGINKILIAETKVLQRKLEQIDADLSLYCLNLKQKLKNPNIRQQLRKAADACYTIDIAEKKAELDRNLEEKSNELNTFEKEHRMGFIWYGIVAILITAFFIITGIVQHRYSKKLETYTELIKKYKNNDSREIASIVDPFSTKGKTISVIEMEVLTRTYEYVTIPAMKWCHKWWLVLAAYTILCVAFLIFYVKFHKGRKSIIELYDDKIKQLSNERGQLEKQQRELGIKFHLAGAMLTQFFTINDQLETKHKILESFLLNIRALVENNENIIKEMSPDVQPPFIPMLKNKDLDSFFTQKSDDLTNKIHLYQFFEGYQISIEAFEDFRNELKKQMNDIIDEILQNFSMFKYVNRQEQYTYLSAATRDISDFLNELDNRSEVFMLCNDIKALNPSKALYLHTEPNEQLAWQNTYRRAFTIPPICVNIKSRFKIILIRLLDMNLNQIEWYKPSK